MLKHLPVLACLAHLPLAALAGEGGLTFPDQPKGAVTLQLETDPTLQPDQMLQVFVGPKDTCCLGRTPLAGQHQTQDGTLVFKPAFPFLEGQVYTALTGSEDAQLKTEFSVGTDPGLTEAKVVAVYPSGLVIPENTLRFYIEFATPMQPHLAERYVTLTGADGVPDRAAFMSFKQELWNEDRTRLTLLMDPGRIKRGVAQNTALGAALEEGKAYAITIAAGWPSALAGPLEEAWVSAFEIGPALRARPDPNTWTSVAPQQGSLSPLILSFDRPFDRGQLPRLLRVLNAQGAPIEGDVDVQNGEQTWVFRPKTPWATPRVTVVVDARLEDVAGNNFRETLDHALGSAARDVDQLSLSIDLPASN